MAEAFYDAHGVEPQGGRMVRPGSLKTLEDIAAWVYEHDGRIEAWWEAQREHNARATSVTTACQASMQLKMETMGNKIDKMQRTIWLATGGTMMAGGIIGIAVTVAVAVLNGG
jgi:hypothetical protein